MYCLASLDLDVTVDDVFDLTFTLHWAVGFRYVVACGCRGGIRIQQSFDDCFYVGDTTIRNLEVFTIEDFVVRMINAKMLIFELDKFCSYFGFDILEELGVLVNECSSSIRFVLFMCWFDWRV